MTPAVSRALSIASERGVAKFPASRAEPLPVETCGLARDGTAQHKPAYRSQRRSKVRLVQTLLLVEFEKSQDQGVCGFRLQDAQAHKISLHDGRGMRIHTADDVVAPRLLLKFVENVPRLELPRFVALLELHKNAILRNIPPFAHHSLTEERSKVRALHLARLVDEMLLKVVPWPIVKCVYTDHAGCRYEIQGMLTRPDGG
jgi:hypothetical protein